jgi:hypothetical protein
MPVYERGDVRIHYEQAGSGFVSTLAFSFRITVPSIASRHAFGIRA